MPSKTFNFSGEAVKWDVPNDVEVVQVEMTGGGSGDRAAGRVVGNVRTKGVKALWVGVGRKGYPASGRNGGQKAFGGGGAGGDAGLNGDGGHGGGGASWIRINTKDGAIRAVAGGAGGSSGDGGLGGRGGDTAGENGQDASGGGLATGEATGGTQNQGGKGGTMAGRPGIWGADADQAKLGDGGRGGQNKDTANTSGGGGGGGGYRAGGGGQAGLFGIGPGGGGAGGSNYTDGMFQATSYRGTGGTDNGQITLTWDTTNPPTPPTGITINGEPISNELATKATDSVNVKGVPHDPNSKRGVRMLLWVSTDALFKTHQNFKGTYDDEDETDKVTITGLSQDTLYHVRFYTQDVNGNVSTTYTETSFWTNRRPDLPTLVSPAENAQVSAILNVTFTWQHNDPDPSDPQTKWELRWRKMGTPVSDAGDWHLIDGTGSVESWVIDAGTFSGNSFYEWQVRTADGRDRFSEWSFLNSFFVTADTTPPQILSPAKGEAIVYSVDNTFRWKFKSPIPGAKQAHADIRFRPYNVTDWTTLFGDGVTPGSTQKWVIPAETFEPNTLYYYEVRTVSDTGLTSDWSDQAAIWVITTPGSGAGSDPLISGEPAAPLGVGDNRVFVATRGGGTLIGELTPLVDVKWNRKRDDISTCTIHMNSWDEDMKGLLRGLRSWVHEIVVFRDAGEGMKRVWEGPIVRKSSSVDFLEMEAWDVMAYVYRRIMRQGYNDAYRLIDGEQTGLNTVVYRASQIIMNCLAYDDPNVLPYLTVLNNAGDARNSRVRKDYTYTAWEEVDSLAAKAGLDYATVGRRIILNDTHRPVGRLPTMKDGDFGDPPIVTEYGMSLANEFAVTNNNGLYGIARRGLTFLGEHGPEGFVEMLASSFGESEGAGTERTLTRKAAKEAKAALAQQADRNISGRYSQDRGPSPVAVRVPDNTTLSPNVNIGINQLIPGVWVPLRCDTGLQTVEQWQKLDSMEVTQDASGEKITITLSVAPNAGQDPDADEAATED